MDDTVTNPIKITISGKLSYEDNISLNQAAQIIAFIDSSSGANFATTPAAATRLAPVQIANPGLTASTPREALDNAAARTNPEKIVAFAGLIHAEGKDTFTLEDIKPLFRRAREATPKNLTRDFDVVIRLGWADEGEAKGEYYLTKKAMSTLESGFERERTPRKSSGPSTPKSTGTRRPRKAIEVPESFSGIDPIPASLDGVVDYTDLGTQKDRFLWVLKLAKTLGIDGLDNKDVVWLTDHLGAGLPSNNVGKTFSDARAAGNVNKSTQTHKIRITPKGEAYLATVQVPGK